MTTLELPRYTCALGGALAFVSALDKAVPIIHAGPGCGMVLSTGQFTCGGYQYVGHTGCFQIPSSNMLEKHVVFGGEDRLREQIKNTLDIIDADIYFVIAGCTSGLIGDNVRSVVGEFSGNGKHILYAETAGFSGSSYTGYDMAYNALIDNAAKPTKQRTKNLVNLFGLVAGQNPFWQGDIEEIARLLGLLGVEVNLSGYKDSVKKFENAARAELNIVLSGSTGVAVAEHLEEKFGTPYLTYPLPVGSDTSNFLREVAKKLRIPKRTVEAVIKSEEDKFWAHLIKYTELYAFVLSNKEFNVIGDSTNAIGATRFLTDDLGLLPNTVVLVDNPREDLRPSIRERFGDLQGLEPKVLFDGDSGHIWEHLSGSGAEIVLGSSSDRLPARQSGSHLIPYSYPLFDQVVLSKGYSGYRGAINLAEEIGCRLLSG